jgi:branched-chain amino acid transport system ATP-binding protein
MSAPTPTNEAFLAVRDLAAGYGGSEVLHGVRLEVRAGEIVTLVGANGAGKSTLLASIVGLTDIRRGRIEFGGRPITGLPPYQLVRLGLALVPQVRSVFPSLTVYENLEMGGYTLPRHKVLGNIETAFGYFPRLRERFRQRAGTLSGGERQMLAIARGLMTEPQLLMLDEPSMGLAPKVVESVFEQIQQIHARGTTIFLVEQNARRALSIADRAYVMELGRIRHEGTGQGLLSDPEVQRAYLGG